MGPEITEKITAFRPESGNFMAVGLALSQRVTGYERPSVSPSA